MTILDLYQWRRAIASEHGPEPIARHILLTLSLRMDRSGGSCFPSINTLVEETGLSNKTVCKYLNIAEKVGWIKRFSRKGSQGWRRNHYEATMPIKFESKCDEPGTSPQQKGGEPQGKDGVSQDKGGEPQGNGGVSQGVKVVNQVHTNYSVNYSKNYPVENYSKNLSRIDTPAIPPIKKSEVLTRKQTMREDAKKVVNFINQLSGKEFQHSKSSLEPIIARMNQGATLDECLRVCQNKWDDPDHKEKYYRPTTLFRASLFEAYLNESGRKPKLSKQKANLKKSVEVFARRHYARHNKEARGD